MSCASKGVQEEVCWSLAADGVGLPECSGFMMRMKSCAMKVAQGKVCMSSRSYTTIRCGAGGCVPGGRERPRRRRYRHRARRGRWIGAGAAPGGLGVRREGPWTALLEGVGRVGGAGVRWPSGEDLRSGVRPGLERLVRGGGA